MELHDVVITRIYEAKNGDFHVAFKIKPEDIGIVDQQELRGQWRDGEALDLTISPGKSSNPPQDAAN